MYDKMMEVTRHKDRVKVYVKCTDGDYFTGHVHLEKRQRLSDLMNDPRGFVPLEQENGRTVVLAKASIRWIGDLRDGEDDDY